MIYITIERRSEEEPAITSYRVEGHAMYANPGKDIVCSAVSAITVGTVNSVGVLTGQILGAEMEEGWLEVIVPSDLPDSSAAQVQLLLESMVVMLSSIEDNYGDYITLQTTYGKGG